MQSECLSTRGLQGSILWEFKWKLKMKRRTRIWGELITARRALVREDVVQPISRGIWGSSSWRGTVRPELGRLAMWASASVATGSFHSVFKASGPQRDLRLCFWPRSFQIQFSQTQRFCELHNILSFPLPRAGSWCSSAVPVAVLLITYKERKPPASLHLAKKFTYLDKTFQEHTKSFTLGTKVKCMWLETLICVDIRNV